MECTLIQPELVLYHFGTIEPAMRREVESHLLGCRACLEGFVALKRHLETDTESGPRPSARARLKLRAEVEQEIAPRALRAPWRRAASWGFAAAAAAVLAAIAIQTTSPSRPPVVHDVTGIPVDSANPAAAGLSVL